MSIQNFPRVSVDTSKFDLPVFTPAVAPVRIPTKTYDWWCPSAPTFTLLIVFCVGLRLILRLTPRSPASCSTATLRLLSTQNNLKLLPASELLDYYATARVVLVQGGPGSIQDAPPHRRPAPGCSAPRRVR